MSSTPQKNWVARQWLSRTTGTGPAWFAALKERTKREKKILETELAVAGAGQEDIKQALKAMGPFDSVREPNEKMVPFVEKYEDAYVNTAHKAVQFIPGVEMYEAAPVEGDAHRWHIIFYAKDWQGAKALFLLCNLAQLNKHNDLPRCTTETMRLFLGEGATGTRSCYRDICLYWWQNSGYPAETLLQFAGPAGAV